MPKQTLQLCNTSIGLNAGLRLSLARYLITSSEPNDVDGGDKTIAAITYVTHHQTSMPNVHDQSIYH